MSKEKDNEKVKKRVEELLKKAQHEDVTKVELDDKVECGCIGCGDCCRCVEFNINSFDLYRMYNKFSDNTKMRDKIIHNSSINIIREHSNANELYIPVIQYSFRNSKCVFLKMGNGRYVCELGDAKPIICTFKHFAVSYCISSKNDLIKFVPYDVNDKDISKIDLDEFIKNHRDNSMVFYTPKNCKGMSTKESSVKDCVSERLKYVDEINLTRLNVELLNKYVDFKGLERLLLLSNLSSLNNETNEEEFSYNKIMQVIFEKTYYWIFDYLEAGDDRPYIELIKEQIKKNEENIYPRIRQLAKSLRRIYACDKYYDILDSIIDCDDEKLAQERFDNYFEQHKEEIRQATVIESFKIISERM